MHQTENRASHRSRQSENRNSVIIAFQFLQTSRVLLLHITSNVIISNVLAVTDSYGCCIQCEFYQTPFAVSSGSFSSICSLKALALTSGSIIDPTDLSQIDVSNDTEALRSQLERMAVASIKDTLNELGCSVRGKGTKRLLVDAFPVSNSVQRSCNFHFGVSTGIIISVWQWAISRSGSQVEWVLSSTITQAIKQCRGGFITTSLASMEWDAYLKSPGIPG